MTMTTFEIHGDIFETHAPGTLDLADIERMFVALAALRERHPRVFTLARAGGPGMTSDARKRISEWFRATPVPIECAVYEVGAFNRAVIDMMQRAVNFLSPGKLIIVSFKTREEALAWIAERRNAPAPALV